MRQLSSADHGQNFASESACIPPGMLPLHPLRERLGRGSIHCRFVESGPLRRVLPRTLCTAMRAMPSADRPRGRKRRIVSCGGDGQKFPYRLLQMRGLWEEVIVTSGRAWLLPDGRPPALQTVSSESPAAQMKATATLLASHLLIDLFIW